MGGPLVAMPGLRTVFPSAAKTQMGGYAMSSWLTMAPGANPMAMMRAGDAQVADPVAYVHALIRREIARGVPSTARRRRLLPGRAGRGARGAQLPRRAARRLPRALHLLWRRQRNRRAGECGAARARLPRRGRRRGAAARGDA